MKGMEFETSGWLIVNVVVRKAVLVTIGTIGLTVSTREQQTCNIQFMHVIRSQFTGSKSVFILVKSGCDRFVYSYTLMITEASWTPIKFLITIKKGFTMVEIITQASEYNFLTDNRTLSSAIYLILFNSQKNMTPPKTIGYKMWSQLIISMTWEGNNNVYYIFCWQLTVVVVVNPLPPC